MESTNVASSTVSVQKLVYKLGLTPEEEVDNLFHDIYFRRPGLETELEVKLRSSRFFAVIGPAVSGKTQVVRKGLLERLESPNGGGLTGINGESWMVVNTQPEATPIQNLARDIFNELEHKEDGDQEAIEELLAQSSRGLLDVYDQFIVPDQADPFNLLLVIDNVEDLFRYKALIQEEFLTVEESDDLSQEVAYLNLLMNAARKDNRQTNGRIYPKAIYILLLLDQSYLNELVDFPEVHELVNDNRLFVPPFAADQILSTLDQNWEQALRRSVHDPLALEKDERELGRMLLEDLAAELHNVSPTHIPQVLFEFQFTLSRLREIQETGAELSQAYIDMGRVNRTFNNYIRSRYFELSPKHRFICERMFKALTFFDPNNASKSSFAPYSRPTLKENLVAICQGNRWDQNPFEKLRQQEAQRRKANQEALKGQSIRTQQVTPTAQISYLDEKEVEESLSKIINESFNKIFPLIRVVDFNYDQIIDLGRVIFLTDWEQLRDWVLAENEGASVYSKIVESAQDYFQSLNMEAQTLTAVQQGDLQEATQKIERQNEKIKEARSAIDKLNTQIQEAEEAKGKTLEKLASVEQEGVALQAQLESDDSDSGELRSVNEIKQEQEQLRATFSDLNEKIKEHSQKIDQEHKIIRSANKEISQANAVIDHIATQEELEARLNAEKKSWSTLWKDFRKIQVKSLTFRLLCKDQRRLQEAQILDLPTDLYLYDEVQNAFNFWRNTLPNPVWAQQYIPLVATPQQIADGQAEGETKTYQAPIWEAFLKGTNEVTSFDLVEEFLRLSDAENWRREGREKRRQEAEANCFRKITKMATIFSIFALIASVVSVIFYLNAKNSENNLRLTNFVDVLLKARIISESNLNVDSDTFNTAANLVLLRSVKDQIKRKETKDIYMVMDTLVEYDYVAFAPPADEFRIPGLPDPELYTQSSKYALALIEQLDRQELNVRNGIGLNSIEAGRFFNRETITYQVLNDTLNNTINKTAYFQGPYIYYCLQEHIRAYRRIILAKGDSLDRKQVKGDHFTLNAQVVSVASNPEEVEHFAVGDRKGMARIFEAFPHRYSFISAEAEQEKIPLDGEITALGYTHDGDYLIAGTSRGQLFYCPKVSDPAGRRLYWRSLSSSVNGPIRHLSVGIRGEENHLLIGTDTDLQFAFLIVDGEEVRLASSLETIPARPEDGIYGMGTNHDGDTIIVGGADQTMIYHLPPTGNIRPQLLKVIEHPGTTVTAAGISHQAHLHRIDTLTAGPTVALGSESGKLWLVPMSELLRRNTLSPFWEEATYHHSTITNLEFNDELPQMVSASLDGAIRFWNMELVCLRKEAGLESQFDWFDHLRVENDKEGVFGAFFINRDQLISVHSTSLHLWKTNPDALIEEANHLFRIQEGMYLRN